MEPSSRQIDEQNAEASEEFFESEESFEVEREDHMRGEDSTPAGSRFVFGQAWMVAACVLLIAAALLLYFGRPSAAFVAAALGVSAWFLNMRDGLKRKHGLVKRGGRNWEPRSGGSGD